MIPGFGFLKLILLTSIIAVAEAVVIESGLFVVARFRGFVILATTAASR